MEEDEDSEEKKRKKKEKMLKEKIKKLIADIADQLLKWGYKFDEGQATNEGHSTLAIACISSNITMINWLLDHKFKIVRYIC